LITDKKKTPLLWKVLSKEFKSYLSFGIVKKSSGLVYEKMKIKDPPAIIGFMKNIYLGERYTGKIKPL